MKVGFVGLGHMGSGMAASLLKAGHEVIVYNRTRAKAEPLIAHGATAVASIADACREGAVVTMLANDNAVEGVALGKGGIIDSPPKGGIHISSSTISVALSEASGRPKTGAATLAKVHAKAGHRFCNMSKWQDEKENRNRRSIARLTRALPGIFPSTVLSRALERPFVPPTPPDCN